MISFRGHHNNLETSANSYQEPPQQTPANDSLSSEVEIFFGLLFILFVIIGIVKYREYYESQQFRYQPL